MLMMVVNLSAATAFAPFELSDCLIAAHQVAAC